MNPRIKMTVVTFVADSAAEGLVGAPSKESVILLQRGGVSYEGASRLCDLYYLLLYERTVRGGEK